MIILKRRCDLNCNEKTLHKRPNDTRIINFRSQYGFNNDQIHTAYSQLLKAPK